MAQILLKPVFKEAWHKVAGTKQTFFITFVVLGLIQLALLGVYTYLRVPFPHTPWLTGLSVLLWALCCIPITTALSMMGLNRARDQKIQLKEGFIYFKKSASLFLTSIMMIFTLWMSAFIITFLLIVSSGHSLNKTIIVLNFISNLVWTFIFGPLLSFSLINTADQNQSPWQAYKNSFKMTLSHFRVCMLAFITCFLFNLAAAAAFGIGLIWSLPFSYIVIGILYREISQSSESPPPQGGGFNNACKADLRLKALSLLKSKSDRFN